MKKPKIGQLVRIKSVPVEPHFHPTIKELIPGMTGTVGAIAAKVRMVSGPGYDGNSYLACVDFDIGGQKIRGGVNFCNLETV